MSLRFDEAERALIAVALVRADAIETVELPAPDDFCDRDHATLWRAVRELQDAGTPVSLISIKEHVSTNGATFVRATPWAYFSEMLTEAIPDPEHTRYVSERVREYAARRRRREELQRELAELETEDTGPPRIDDRDAYVRQLAHLDPLEYDRQREEAAKTLGCRVGTLDAEVKRRRGEEAPFTGKLVFVDPEPAEEPVDGAGLLKDLVQTLTRYVVLPRGASTAMALWVLHTFAHDTASVSPILSVTSPEKRCGKSTALLILRALVRRPLPASHITSAALFRATEKWTPTLLIDEADTFLRDADELRGVLNSGHARAGAFIIRAEGEDHEPKVFSTWAPKAIALIGTLPPTLTDRSIRIPMRRKTAADKVERLRLDRMEAFRELPRRCARWVQDNETRIRRADPKMPPGINDRTADNWRHLVALADLAGGDWPERARAALRALADDAIDSEGVGVLLLSDLRDLFVKHGHKIPSETVVKELGQMEERPWPEWTRNGEPITVRQLAKLLRPFKIAPRNLRMPDGKIPKGYLLEQFEDAFTRYLPPPTATPLQPANGAQNSQSATATSILAVADRESGETPSNTHCSCVADPTGGPWEETV